MNRGFTFYRVLIFYLLDEHELHDNSAYRIFIFLFYFFLFLVSNCYSYSHFNISFCIYTHIGSSDTFIFKLLQTISLRPIIGGIDSDSLNSQDSVPESSIKEKLQISSDGIEGLKKGLFFVCSVKLYHIFSDISSKFIVWYLNNFNSESIAVSNFINSHAKNL